MSNWNYNTKTILQLALKLDHLFYYYCIFSPEEQTVGLLQPKFYFTFTTRKNSSGADLP